MSVGAADAERADPGPAGAVAPRPRPPLGDHRQGRAARGELRVGLGQVEGRRDLAVVQRERRLDQPGHPRGAVQVTDVGLDRADPDGLTVEHPLQCGQFGGVAQPGAGAVRLDVVDVGRAQPSGGDRLGDYARLSGHAGRGEADLPAAVVVDRPAAQHRVHPVAVGERVLQPAQRDHADPTAQWRALPGRVERPADAVRRGDAAGLVVVADTLRHADRDAAGERQVTFDVRQAGRGHADRDERGRAVALDPERRPGQPEVVRHPQR